MPRPLSTVWRVFAMLLGIVLVAALIAMFRASTILLRPRRIVPPDRALSMPGMLPFAYNWPTLHPMTVLGPWPGNRWDEAAIPLRAGDEVVSVDGLSLNWESWGPITRRLRERGAGASARLEVRRERAADGLREVDVRLDREVWRPSDLGLAYVDVTHQTERGNALVGWYLPCGRDTAPTVIALHGMAASRHSMLIAFGQVLVKAGYNVFIPDAAAHGESSGLNTDLVGTDEVRAHVEAVLAQRTTDPTRVVLLGHSYGAVKALVGAVSVPGIAAVVTVASPLTVKQGIQVVATKIMHLPAALVTTLMPLLSLWVLLRTGNWLGDADARRAASRWHGPLLVIQGTLDELWPPGTAQTLYDAGAGPKELVTVLGADHNGVLVAGDPILRPLLNFLKRTVG